ncbi:MAG TPA: AIR synthase-related protein, partial [Stellaceae bacterium]|nr:AIR synthase-related protein [Stellaceae bacterium]
LKVRRGGFAGLAPEHRAFLADRYRLPDPRVELGPRLVGIANSLIDVSDGLAADLGHICEQSAVSAMVQLPAVPISEAAALLVAGDPTLHPRLATGGDDYELLFTAAADQTAAIEELSASLELPITEIGTVGSGAGVRLLGADGKEIALNSPGWEHF